MYPSEIERGTPIHISIYTVYYMQASTLDFHGNMGSPVTEFPHRCPVHRAVGAPSNAKKPGGIAASSLWLQGMEKPAIKMELFWDGLLTRCSMVLEYAHQHLPEQNHPVL